MVDYVLRLWIGLILSLAAVTLHAGDLVIAVNPRSTLSSLSEGLLRDIYLRKRIVLNGIRLLPINLPPRHPMRKCFEEKILHRQRGEIERAWMRAHYRGIRPPKVVPSQESAARYVMRLSNALAYMDQDVADAFGLKILFRVSQRSLTCE